MNNEKEKEIELENQKEEINEIVGDYKYGFKTFLILVEELMKMLLD